MTWGQLIVWFVSYVLAGVACRHLSRIASALETIAKNTEKTG